MDTLITAGVIAVVAIIVLLIGYIMFRRSYRVAAPNEALVITGRSQRRGAEGDIDLEAASRVVVGGRGTHAEPEKPVELEEVRGSGDAEESGHGIGSLIDGGVLSRFIDSVARGGHRAE